MKGVYQSIRLAHVSIRMLSQMKDMLRTPSIGNRLIVNLDVSNGTFWTESTLWTTVLAMTKSRILPPLSTHLLRADK
jgi:hypothetical protein